MVQGREEGKAKRTINQQEKTRERWTEGQQEEKWNEK